MHEENSQVGFPRLRLPYTDDSGPWTKYSTSKAEHQTAEAGKHEQDGEWKRGIRRLVCK